MKIFTTTGSRSFQFDRLIRALDDTDFSYAVGSHVEVFAQIGSGTYRPRNIEYIDFMPRDEFARRMEEADAVITHGGTGAVIGAVTKGKKVVAVPRLPEFHEAVDGHQVEFVRQFESMGIIRGCFDLSKLADDVAEVLKTDFFPYKSNTEVVLSSIDEFLREVLVDKRGGRW